MRVGITYDLREDYLAQGYSQEETAEFDAVETIQAIESALQKCGFIPERIGNIYQLTEMLVQGKSWDLVFNIAEGLFGSGREAQVPALLDAYRIPYTFSDPVTLAVTLDKALTKHIVRDHGIVTAPFTLVSTEEDIAACHLAFPVFAKPVAEGTGKGITAASHISSAVELRRVCKSLLHQYQQPVLVESFLSGREFTVGILGTGRQAEVIGVVEIVLRDTAEQNVYSFNNKEHCEERVHYCLVGDEEAQQAAATALAAWVALGCRDAGRVDLRSDAYGVPHFMETNPLSGLHPTHSDLPILWSSLGFSYDDLIQRIVSATLARLTKTSNIAKTESLLTI